jgi:hypothetical protein
MKSLRNTILEKLVLSQSKIKVYDLIEIILMSCNNKNVVKCIRKNTNGETAEYDKNDLLDKFIDSLRDNFKKYMVGENIKDSDEFCDDFYDYIKEFEFDEYYYSYKDFNDYDEYRITVDNYFTGDADMYEYENMAEAIYRYIEKSIKYIIFYENSDINKMYDNNYEYTLFDILIKYSELVYASDADNKIQFEDEDAQAYFNK